MREIRFRGKRVDANEWVYGYIFKTNKANPLQEETSWIFTESGKYKVIPKTVGQFTGITDKNGVKIFERDVVFAGYGEYYQGTHEHSTTIIIDMSNYDALNALCNANVVEVIGNIHDQKEDVC